MSYKVPASNTVTNPSRTARQIRKAFMKNIKQIQFQQPEEKRRKLEESRKTSDFISSTGLSAKEKLLNLDQIMEKIFLNMETKTLLQTRFVSQRFRKFSEPILHERTRITFKDFKFYPQHNHNHNRSVEKKSLNELRRTLRRSKEFRLPCSHFKFAITCDLTFDLEQCFSLRIRRKNQIFKSFLNQYGKQITVLDLSIYNTWDHSESNAMQQVLRILRKTPNVQQLKLNITCKIQWKEPLNKHDYSPLEKSDPEYNEIHQGKYKIVKGLNPSLTSFQYSGVVSAKIFELINVMAPNLNQVQFDSYNSHLFVHFLLKPCNRIHMLKEWKLEFNSCLDLPERIVCAIKEKREFISIKNICIGMTDSVKNLQLCNQNYVRRLVNVVNSVLECCSHSLKKLYWDDMVCLPDLKWPSILPNVRCLKISPIRFDYDYDEGERDPDVKLPFYGFKIKTKFPKLKRIYIEEFLTQEFSTLLKCLEFGPMPLVKTVVARSSIAKKFCINLMDANRIFTLFPNANLEIKVR